MLHQFQGQSVSDFHIRSSAAENPFPAFQISAAGIIHVKLADFLRDFFHIEGRILQRTEFVHIHHIVMPRQNNRIRISRHQLHVGSNQVSSQRVAFNWHTENMFRVVLEVRIFLQNLFNNICSAVFICSAADTWCLHHTYHGIVHSLSVDHTFAPNLVFHSTLLR